MEELFHMSEKELDRLKILHQVKNKQLRQKQAAKLLHISDRWIRVLLRDLECHGLQAIVSKKRGKPSNRQMPPELKRTILKRVREKYTDFAPTLAKEKLEEIDGIKISTETLRLWMIENHMWIPRKTKKNLHLPRNRRELFGELIQADGSHHHWFGEDGPVVNLNVFIDDATSRLTSLIFSRGETLESYILALEKHLKKFGKPRAFYTDRSTIFQSAKKGSTQMQRILEELDIELILANTPQAKGRVERANRTLQDRLLKELKLRGIKTIEEANIFADEFIETYNKKFSKRPMKDLDAHRPLEEHDIDRVLRRVETRTLLTDLTFQFNKSFYKIQGNLDVRRAKGRKVEVRINSYGEMKVYMQKQELKVEKLGEESPTTFTNKELAFWDSRQPRMPVWKSHPWKKYGYQLYGKSRFKKYH